MTVELTRSQWALVLEVLDWEDAGPSEIGELQTKNQREALARAREKIRETVQK